MKQKDINIKNRRATFDYEIVETFTAGMVLTGTEIKSIRGGHASLVDTFCYVNNGEVWVKNMNIAEYFYGTYNNHAARRREHVFLYILDGKWKITNRVQRLIMISQLLYLLKILRGTNI